MVRYVVVSLCSGILFGVLDGVIHANPLARDLYAVFQPIARRSVNVPAGVAIDLAWGFAMALIFLLLYGSLPGGSGLMKGLAFGVLAWFFRVAMQAASQWMQFAVPARTLLYDLAAGLGEMLILGLLYGLLLKPWKTG